MHNTNINNPFNWIWKLENRDSYMFGGFNGKIVAECEIETERIEFVDKYYPDEDLYDWYQTESMREDELLRRSCLSHDELDNYLFANDGYAIHISNLKIFDKPLDLGQFQKKVKKWTFTEKDGQKTYVVMRKSITRAPQNMCNAYDHRGYHYVAISIRPEWICEILNGKKDIEVRRQVLNRMKG